MSGDGVEGYVQISSSSAFRELHAASIARQQTLLPTHEYRRDILYLVQTSRVLVLVGHTGSGKTTQIPRYLEETGWADGGRVIACTQPRRVSAVSVAHRVAHEYGSPLGERVGYAVRFEDVSGPRTAIKYMTDGTLLREAMADPLLSRYSVIMIDEAHERSLHTDMLIGLLRKIQRRRPELRLIISSATLAAQDFADYFSRAPHDGAPDAAEPPLTPVALLSIEGRPFPVDILYCEKPVDDYVAAAVKLVLEICDSEDPGDVLVFLTGRSEIEACMDEFSNLLSARQREALQILPLYAGLPIDAQEAVFATAPPGVRKVIVATNVAEASVTIDGIAIVVDCGFVKLRVYDVEYDAEKLAVYPVSKASAIQRAGRAGRTRPGKCFRLYPERAYDSLPDTTPTEMQRSNITGLVLQLKALGIANLVRFDYLTAPPALLLQKALETLHALGALDGQGRLVEPLGAQMAELPLEPRMAKALLDSVRMGCSSEMLGIMAMMCVDTDFFVGSMSRQELAEHKWQFTAEEGDHITLLNILTAYAKRATDSESKLQQWCHRHGLNARALARAHAIRAQLARVLARFRLPETVAGSLGATTIRKCLLLAYDRNIVRQNMHGRFNGIDGQEYDLHASSVLYHRRCNWAVYTGVEDGKLRYLSTIEQAWI